MLLPGDSAYDLLLLREDSSSLKLYVETAQNEQQSTAFEEMPVLDAAGNIFVTKLCRSEGDSNNEEEAPLEGTKKSSLGEIKAPGKERASRKRKKTPKDLNAPKKNVTAYIHFVKHIRDEVKAKNPALHFAGMGILIGKMYRELLDNERQHWDEVALVDKERYEREMLNYNEQLLQQSETLTKQKGEAKQDLTADDRRGSEASKNQLCDILGLIQDKDFTEQPPKKKSKKTRQAPKNPKEPKKNVTAYIHYSKHVRDQVKAKYPDLNFVGIGIEIGKLYRELSEEGRQRWEEVARLDKERYDREIVAYIQLISKESEVLNADMGKTSANTKTAVKHGDGGMENEESTKLVPTKKGKKRKHSMKDTNAPKNNKSPYILYSSHIREKVVSQNPGLDFAGIGVLVGKMYRELSDKEKGHWEEKARLDKERYSCEMAEYNQTKRQQTETAPYDSAPTGASFHGGEDANRTFENCTSVVEEGAKKCKVEVQPHDSRVNEEKKCI